MSALHHPLHHPLHHLRHQPVRRPAKRLPWWCSALALAALLPAAGANAAGKTDAADRLARYQQDRAVCTSGKSNQDRATCLREASASYAEAQRGGLGDGSLPYASNARERCNRLPEADRLDCVARMQGQGSSTGTAASGGIYRELTTREVTPPNPPVLAKPSAAIVTKPTR